MLLPIRTNVQPYRTPYTNYGLILVNVLIFLATYSFSAHDLKPWVHHMMLTPGRPQLWQFITYAFLHGGVLHIAGNMFFLYIFGNNVNDKLGNFGYLCFYLAGGIFSAIGHTLINANPIVGASGAIAAVTGAYLVFFPQTLITIVYWFFIIGTVPVPALWFIAFKMIFYDNVIARYGGSYIAYDAHLSGYAFGILSSLILLATGLTSTSHFDLWAMIKQWNRRRQYRDSITTGYNPYTGQGSAKQIKSKVVSQADDQEIQKLRNEIANYIYQHDLHAAADAYMALMSLDNNQVIPLRQLLDIANQLASENRHQEAALAYEIFLANYGSYEFIEHVQLMLGLIYARYLDNPVLAAKHLTAAERKLTDPDQLKLCRGELDNLQNR